MPAHAPRLGRLLAISLVTAVAGAALLAGAPLLAARTVPIGAAAPVLERFSQQAPAGASRSGSAGLTSASNDPGAGAPTSLPLATVSSDARWILSAQLGDGAILNYPGGNYVSPYMSNEAAEGLARASELTGDAQFAAAAWRWLGWYQRHEGQSGFVTDYKVVGGALVSTGDMDSTDAYAGTFLSASLDAWSATHNSQQLAALRPGIAGAMSAIEATQGADGLTWAKPTWRVAYLMDQAETFAGLRAAVQLGQALGDQALAARAAGDAAKMAAGVAAMWDPAEGAFCWARHADGFCQPTNWAQLYPDALEQMWAVAYGLATPSQGAAITSRFLADHPEWDHPSAPALVNGSQATAGYHAVAGWGLIQAGDTAAASAAAGAIQAGADSSGMAWPFTPADAATLIILASGGPDAPTPGS